MSLASGSAFPRSGPSPRMSIAVRDAKWTMLSKIRPGQETLGQYTITSSGGCSTFDLQTGHRSGGRYDRARRTPFLITGPSTCGMTSPARVTSTRSLSLMSLALISSKLWSVGDDRQLLAGSLDVEAEDPQAPAARDLGIELAQRTRRGVARIGEGRLAGALALLVELGEA